MSKTTQTMVSTLVQVRRMPERIPMVDEMEEETEEELEEEWRLINPKMFKFSFLKFLKQARGAPAQTQNNQVNFCSILKPGETSP